ncbi:MAG: VWA domain-containing protein [Acidimicrobiales bacterium]
MSFLAPAWFWLLVPVAVLAGLYVVMQLRRRRYAVRFTNVELLDRVAPRRPGWRRHVPAGLFVLAMVVLVVGAARPATEVQVPRERATVVLTIDTSLSMEADDVEPSRFGAAKEAAVSFLDRLPRTINVGLVSFHGIARLDVPPTTDRARVRSAILVLDLGEGTAIGEAVFASLDALENVPEAANDDEPVPGRIVVLSDGETTVGRSNQEAVEAASEAEIPVSTIAFGTQSGEIRIDGERVPVAVNEAALEEIADRTGGAFYTAVTEAELTEVYEDIGSSIGFVTEEEDVTYRFVTYALLPLLAAAALSLLWFARLP